MSALFVGFVRFAYIRVYKRARLTQNDKHADHMSWPAWAPASTTFLSIYEWKWHKKLNFELVNHYNLCFTLNWLKCSECWVEYVWTGFMHRISGMIVFYSLSWRLNPMNEPLQLSCFADISIIYLPQFNVTYCISSSLPCSTAMQ